MSVTERMQMLSGILGLVALGLAVLGLVATAGGRWLTSWPRAVALHRAVLGAAPLLALGVAATATAGSLYFSEVAGYVPCNLCWYQRIAMYSSAVILMLAVVLRDRGVAPYVMVLSLLGLVISAYHYVLEWNPGLESDVCSIDIPCTTIWFRQFGFMSLPFLAGCAFLALVSLMSVIVGSRTVVVADSRVARNEEDRS